MVALILFAGVLSGCQWIFPSNVELQGQLTDLPQSGNARGLSSAAVSVAALPVMTADLDESAVDIQPVAEDGSFLVDVIPPDQESEYVMLAFDETQGVGVEQFIGWMELPVGADESTAGWPLGGAARGTTIDLGAMSGSGGTFLPGSDTNAIYETLNQSQTDLLFQAQRDNYLKIIKNELNQDSLMWLKTSYGAGMPLSPVVNADLTPTAAIEQFSVSYEIKSEEQGALEDDPDFTYEAWLGNVSIAVYPPAEIRAGWDGEVFSPQNPLTGPDFNYFGSSPEDGILTIGVEGVSPPGAWIYEVQGEKDGAYDLAISSPYDQDGNFVYFFPVVRVNADAQTSRITSLERRWAYWDVDTGQYTQLPVDVQETLPLFGGAWFFLTLDGETDGFDFNRAELVQSAGEPGTYIPTSDVFLPPAGDVSQQLLQVQTGYQLLPESGIALNFNIGEL